MNLPALSSTPSWAALADFPVRAQASGLIRAPCAQVWQTLVAVEAWPNWMPRVQRVNPCPPLAVGQGFRWKADGLWIRSTITRFEAPHHLSWQGAAFGTRALHLWLLEPTAEGTRVQTLEGFTGLLPRLFRASFQKQLDTALQEWVTALREAAEKAATPR